MTDPMAERRCTAANKRDGFCDALSIPQAPFPICVHHASLVYTFLRGVVDDPGTRNILDRRAAEQVASAVKRPRLDVTGLGVVYYVQIGELLKIGTTDGRVWDRLSSYPPHRELLAAEPGGYVLEAQRLNQFRHLRAATGREWHHFGADLHEHIAAIRDRHGIPEKHISWRPAGSSDLSDPKILMRRKNADHELTPIEMPKVGTPEMDAYLDSLGPDA